MLVRVFALIAIVGAVVTSMSSWRGAALPVADAPEAVAMASRAETATPRRNAAQPAPDAVDTAQAPVRAATQTARAWVSRQQEFERTGDLFAFAQRLQPAADAGDGEARWLVSRVHEYCDGYARAPADYDRDTALIDSLALRAARPLGDARSRVAARCGRFVPDDTLSFVQLVELRKDAAAAGSLAAEAALLTMGEPLEDDPAYRRDLVARVQIARDPEAYAALAPAMGLAAVDDVALAGRFAGTQAAELGWRLAGCRLGLDCTPEGALMTTYCASGGICAQTADQDFSTFVREAALSPGEADEVDHMVNALVDGQRVGMVMR